jgi:phage baseplate assembly protein W
MTETYQGMGATDGRGLAGLAHVRQSIEDILRTPIGTRVMRREYGSALFALVDAPMDAATVVEIVQAVAAAIGRWEPRVRIQRVEVAGATPGHLTLALDLLYLPDGQPARLEGVVV